MNYGCMSNAETIVSALGGPAAIMEALGVKKAAVSNNVTAGSFPPAWFLPLLLMGKEAGVYVPVSLFRWRSSDACSLQDCKVEIHVSNAAGDT